MLLENKNALVYGAGGRWAAVARAFAREGDVFLAGRTTTLEGVAAEIGGGTRRDRRGRALDEQAVEEQQERGGRREHRRLLQRISPSSRTTAVDHGRSDVTQGGSTSKLEPERGDPLTESGLPTR